MFFTTRSFRKIGFFLLFLAAAMLLYQYPIPIFYGYNLQLFGLALMLAVAILKRIPAILLATLFGVLQFFVMDQPLLVWLFTLEMICLSMLQTLTRRNYLYMDAGFWLLLGTPAVWLLSYFQHGEMSSNSLLLLLILAVNGLFNALIVELLVTYIPAFRQKDSPPITINKVLSHLAITSVTIPFIISAIIIGWNQSESIIDRAAKLSASIADGLQGQLKSWNRQDIRLLQLESLIHLGRLQDMTENYMRTNRPLQIIILNAEGQPLDRTSGNEQSELSELANRMETGLLYRYRADHRLLVWLPIHSHYYSTADWENAYFVYEAPLVGDSIRIQILAPFTYFAEDSYYVYTVNFAFILCGIIAASIICVFTSRILAKYVMTLIKATQNLPEEVRTSKDLNLKSSPIMEMNWLKNNFDQIARKLSTIFNESEELHRNLEKQTQELLRQERLLSQLAFTDNLTNLPNRNDFMKYLQQLNDEAVLNEQTSTLTAFLFIDLDNFKSVNDTLGHAAGDELLKEAASLIRKLTGPEKAYRLAGDEFVVVLENTSHQEINQICTRLIDGFRQPVLIFHHSCHIKLSIGVAIHPLDHSDFEQILIMSDKAMYRAKIEGGSRFVYYSDI